MREGREGEREREREGGREGGRGEREGGGRAKEGEREREVGGGRERERDRDGERDDVIVVVGCSHTSTGKKSSVLYIKSTIFTM